MAETNQGTNGRVFISYLRKDKPFVQKLNDALDNAGVQASVDWEGIELASDRMKTISDASRRIVPIQSPYIIAIRKLAEQRQRTVLAAV